MPAATLSSAKSDKLSVPVDDLDYSSSADWKAKYMEVAEMLAETRADLEDFQASSKELEEELEKELERTEKAQQELQVKVAKAENEKDEWKSKFVTLQTTHNTTTTSLQRELDTLRQEHQRVKIQLRELEMGNDDLERNERAISSSLADTEQRYSRVLEEKLLLEHELLDKANLEEESQRLKDELRDANEEIAIVKDQFNNLQKRLSSFSDIPATSVVSSAASQTASDEESLLSTPAPLDLQLTDLSPPLEVSFKEFPPINTQTLLHPSPSTPVSSGQAKLLHRTGVQSSKAALSTPPNSLTRSSTLPAYSGTPSRLPSRTPTIRPTVSRNVSAMSSSTATTATAPKSRGVQMVSEMRARVKILEQKIHTRVPRLRMGSITNRTVANPPMPPPKAGPSSSSGMTSTASTSSISTTHLKPSSVDDRYSRRSIDSDSDYKRTSAADTSGWVLIMEDSPSPIKDRQAEKERRRTSSPSAPSAFRALSNAPGSPTPSASTTNRAPSALSQSILPSRRPQSRLSVSTEGRSSISTNGTTSTASSIPTPSSRPSTPTFLPLPTPSLYQSTIGLKRSTGPGFGAYTQGKRSSYGSPRALSPTFQSTPAYHSNVTVRPTAKVSASLAQSRIGKPNNGGRKSGGEDSLPELPTKNPRLRSGSASGLFGRNPL